MTELIQILVVDDHKVVREGLCAMLIPRNGMEVVGEAADGAEAVEKARTLNPEVILMDLNLPVKSGLEAISEIVQENSEARILVLTSFDEEGWGVGIPVKELLNPRVITRRSGRGDGQPLRLTGCNSNLIARFW